MIKKAANPRKRSSDGRTIKTGERRREHREKKGGGNFEAEEIEALKKTQTSEKGASESRVASQQGGEEGKTESLRSQKERSLRKNPPQKKLNR